MAKVKLIKGKAAKSKRNVVLVLRASIGYVNLALLCYVLARMNDYSINDIINLFK